MTTINGDHTTVRECDYQYSWLHLSIPWAITVQHLIRSSVPGEILPVYLDRYNTWFNDGLEGKVVHFALIDFVWRELSLRRSIALHALMG